MKEGRRGGERCWRDVSECWMSMRRKFAIHQYLEKKMSRLGNRCTGRLASPSFWIRASRSSTRCATLLCDLHSTSISLFYRYCRLLHLDWIKSVYFDRIGRFSSAKYAIGWWIVEERPHIPEASCGGLLLSPNSVQMSYRSPLLRQANSLFRCRYQTSANMPLRAKITNPDFTRGVSIHCSRSTGHS